MLVALVSLRPPHIRLVVLAVISLLGEVGSRPMLSLGDFVRKFLFSGFLDVRLLELILRSFSHGFISQKHVVVLGPELLGLLEVESGLEGRLLLVRLILPPLLGTLFYREFG